MNAREIKNILAAVPVWNAPAILNKRSINHRNGNIRIYGKRWRFRIGCISIRCILFNGVGGLEGRK